MRLFMPAPGPTILIVDDEEDVRGPLRDVLSAAGYAVAEAVNLEAARRALRASKPALIVLDLALPDGSGVDLCREIRASAALSQTPVVMLTGRRRMKEKDEGFAAGADQYLVKPVQPHELLLWVQALLRRIKIDVEEPERIEAGDLTVEVKSHVVRFKGEVIADLTAKEFELLAFLVHKRPQVFSRKEILTKVWRTVAVDNAVDMHLHNLRRKLPQELALRVQSVPGKGFRYFG